MEEIKLPTCICGQHKATWTVDGVPMCEDCHYVWWQGRFSGVIGGRRPVTPRQYRKAWNRSAPKGRKLTCKNHTKKGL